MDFVLDLLQGVGLAAAIGIRPFLPVLLAGALASADVAIDFDGTDFAFLESWPFLLAVLVLVGGADLIARRRADPDVQRGVLLYAMAAVAIVLGALEAAGSLADHDHPVGPGLVLGAAAALLGFAAAGSLFGRVRRRAAPPPGPPPRGSRLRRARRRGAPGAARRAPPPRGGARRRRGRPRPAFPAARAGRARRPRLAAARRPPARGREVRRAAHP